MMKRALQLVAVACLTVLSITHAVACGEVSTPKRMLLQAERVTTGGENRVTTGGENAMTVLEEIDEISTFVAALKAAGWDIVLEMDEPTFTLFAPNNAAFETALTIAGIDEETLLQFSNIENLENILQSHIIVAEVTAEDLSASVGHSFSAMQGSLEVTMDGDTIKVGDAKVIESQEQAMNANIHVVDTVLVPLD